MKKTHKRILSILLIFVLVFALVPMGAFAEDNEIVISSQADYDKLVADSQTDTFEGKTIVLNCDVTASSPIGKATTVKFLGTLDGNGHTVTLNINSASTYQGMVAYNGGIIKNLETTGSISAKSYSGAIAGYNMGTISACVNSATCNFSAGYCAGIAGYSNNTSKAVIINCINKGNVTVSAGYGGGITSGRATVTNCLNTGKVTGGSGCSAIGNLMLSCPVENTFYLKDSGTHRVGTVKTEAEMKDPAFAATLGDAFVAVPGDYPMLAWQAPAAPVCDEHTWGEWETVTAATADKDGVEKRVCSVCGAEETREVPMPTTPCRVSLKGGTANGSFTVPYGETLDITWKFENDAKGAPRGWRMYVNGEEITNYSNSIGNIEASVPTMLSMFILGKPEEIHFTPTASQCKDGASIELNYTKLTPEQCEFELIYVDKDTGEQVGKYAGSDGKGYHAKETYGDFTISASRSTYPPSTYVTRNMPGYKLYMGTNGKVDKQEITLHVGENGVEPKSVTMYVTVNHDTITEKHVQPVKFVDKDGNTIYETTIQVKNHTTGDTTLDLDLSSCKNALEAKGYELPEKTYSVICDGTSHNPDVTVITLGAEESEPTVEPCKVTLKSTNANGSFTVPYGESLDITWKFENDAKGIPHGWRMYVNGEAISEYYNTIGDIDAQIPSNLSMFFLGKPDEIHFTPTEDDCANGKTVELGYTELTREQCEYQIVFVDKDSGEQIGKYAGSDGTGYHAKQTYGENKISASITPTIASYVTMNYSGYILYQGTKGNVDMQNKTLIVGENGVEPKEITMYVVVNHGAATDKHVQPVKFVTADGSVVYETNIVVRNHIQGDDRIELDLNAAKETLDEKGYKLVDDTTYSIICDGEKHSPAETVITVEAVEPAQPDEPESVSYNMIKGAGQTVTKGNEALFASDADFSKFVAVKIDGEEIDSSNYTAVSGSTVITLSKAYTANLSEGNHDIEIVSDDGSATASFSVQNASDPGSTDTPKNDDGKQDTKTDDGKTSDTKDAGTPKTGDDSMLTVWLMLMISSVAGIAVVTKRKTKD